MLCAASHATPSTAASDATDVVANSVATTRTPIVIATAAATATSTAVAPVSTVREVGRADVGYDAPVRPRSQRDKSRNKSDEEQIQSEVKDGIGCGYGAVHVIDSEPCGAENDSEGGVRDCGEARKEYLKRGLEISRDADVKASSLQDGFGDILIKEKVGADSSWGKVNHSTERDAVPGRDGATLDADTNAGTRVNVVLSDEADSEATGVALAAATGSGNGEKTEEKREADILPMFAPAEEAGDARLAAGELEELDISFKKRLLRFHEEDKVSTHAVERRISRMWG